MRSKYTIKQIVCKEKKGKKRKMMCIICSREELRAWNGEDVTGTEREETRKWGSHYRKNKPDTQKRETMTNKGSGKTEKRVEQGYH